MGRKKIGKSAMDGTDDGRAFLPSGSTLLNLALSNRWHGGYVPGSVVNLVGDSSAGKTFLAWHLMAEMAYDPKWDGYGLYYDDAEMALRIPVGELFGQRTCDRVHYRSGGDEGSPVVTVQDFHKRLVPLLKGGDPVLYVLDSFDALTTGEELTRDISDGSYKTEKPKLLGELLRRNISRLGAVGAVLFVISQTRDKIGVTFGEKKTRSGGKALRFYSTHEIWLAVRKHIRYRDEEVGVQVIAKVKKNKVTGRLRTVEFPIYTDYGVDDIASIVDWLVTKGYWKKARGEQTIQTDYGRMTKGRLIDHIEDNGLEAELRGLVQGYWDRNEDELRTTRPPRYGKDPETP